MSKDKEEKGDKIVPLDPIKNPNSIQMIPITHVAVMLGLQANPLIQKAARNHWAVYESSEKKPGKTEYCVCLAELPDSVQNAFANWTPEKRMEILRKHKKFKDNGEPNHFDRVPPPLSEEQVGDMLRLNRRHQYNVNISEDNIQIRRNESLWDGESRGLCKQAWSTLQKTFPEWAEKFSCSYEGVSDKDTASTVQEEPGSYQRTPTVISKLLTKIRQLLNENADLRAQIALLESLLAKS